MKVFRILRTPVGWALFRQGSLRPVMQDEDRQKLLEKAHLWLRGKDVSLRVLAENGTFQDVRL